MLHFDINWASGMPTHAQQTLTLVSVPLPLSPSWKPSPAMPPPAPNGPTAATSWRTVALGLLPGCTAAIACGDIDKAWEALSKLATHFHCHREEL